VSSNHTSEGESKWSEIVGPVSEARIEVRVHDENAVSHDQ
jgi:hypothetical protein